MLVLCGCAGTPTTLPPTNGDNAPAAQAKPTQPSNDFPTLARVEYVYGCMEKSGGANYDTLYHCACSLDKLAEQMPYEEYNKANTYAQLQGLPGERGAELRDAPESETLRNRLKAVQEAANQKCFVKYKEKAKRAK